MSFCKFIFIMFCSYSGSNEPFSCNYTKLYCTFCCNQQISRKFCWTWPSVKLQKNIYNKLMRKRSLLWTIQLFRSIAYNQWHKKKQLYTALFLEYCFKLVFATSWKIQKWLIHFRICLKKDFSFTIHCKIRTSWSYSFNGKETKIVRHYAQKNQQIFKKGCNESAATINLTCNEFFTRGLPKNRKILLINRESNIHALLRKLPIHIIHWLNLLMLKILRLKKFAFFFYHCNLKTGQQNWNLKH